MSNIEFNSNNDLIAYSKNNNTVLIVLFFTATWCNPCKKLKPFIETKKEQYPAVLFHYIDVDNENNQDICNTYNISAMPTLVFIKNQEKLGSVIGANTDEIDTLLLQNN